MASPRPSMLLFPLLIVLSALLVAASPVRRGIARPRPNTVILDPGYMQRAAGNPDQAELGTLKGLEDRLMAVGPWSVTNKQKPVPEGTS